MAKRALIAGATGLVGSYLLKLLLEDEGYAKVIAVTRRPLEITRDRLENIVTDFDRLDKVAAQLTTDDVFCCLGTTIRKAGSQANFRKVDFDYPVKLARLTHQQGAKKLLLVSALGADASSRIFYNRVKGETEQAICKTGFEAVHIFRPSLLLGPRNEQRAAEDAAKWFYKIFNRLIPLRYKAIHAHTVARAMLHYAHNPATGVFVHESQEMQSFGL
ncbi:MAG: oxidoreductase [Cyclobacteriaceae bacterium]|nr:oxidoreductase [Cyclobacteriaceae bacterium]